MIPPLVYLGLDVAKYTLAASLCGARFNLQNNPTGHAALRDQLAELIRREKQHREMTTARALLRDLDQNLKSPLPSRTAWINALALSGVLRSADSAQNDTLVTV